MRALRLRLPRVKNGPEHAAGDLEELTDLGSGEPSADADAPGFAASPEESTSDAGDSESSPRGSLSIVLNEGLETPPSTEPPAAIVAASAVSSPAVSVPAHVEGGWSRGTALLLAVFALGSVVGGALASALPSAEPPQAALRASAGAAAPDVLKVRIEARRGAAKTTIAGAGEDSRIRIVFRVPARAKGIRVTVRPTTAAPARLELRLGARDARVLTREGRVRAKFKTTGERRKVILTVSSNRPSVVYQVRYRVL